MITARRVTKNTTALLLGRVFSLGLGLVYVTVLARYVQAEGMGKIATATSLVSMLILLVNFGLSELIVRDVAGDKSKADIYVASAFLLRGILSIVFGIVIVAITTAAKYPYDTTLIIYIYAFAFILDSFSDVAFSVFSAFETMGYSAVLQTGRDIFNIVWSLGAIYLHASLITIVSISAAVNLLKLVASLAVLRWRFVRPKPYFNGQLCRQLVIVALPFAAVGVIQLVNRQVDTLLLSLYYSEEVVGWFSAANTLVGYALLVPGVFLQAIFPVFARFHVSSREALRQAYRTSFKYLLLLGFPLCVGILAAADQVIFMVYGPGFEEAALALRILAFLLFWMFGFANGALLSATGNQTFLAIVGGSGMVLNVIAAFVLIPNLGFVGASLAAVASGAFFFFPITLVCHRQLGLRLPYMMAFKTLVASLLMGTIVTLSLWAETNPLVSIFAIAPLVYAILLVAFRVIDQEDMTALSQLVETVAERLPAREISSRS